MAATAFRSFLGGVRAAASSFGARALAWSYLASLATTALFFVPFLLYVRGTVAGSAMSTELRGGQIPDWIVDLGGSAATGPAIGTFSVVALALVPVYLLLVVALTGGIFEYHAVALGLRNRARPFLAACGDLVGPNARVAIVEVPVVVVIIIVLLLIRGALALVGSSPLIAWVWLVALVVVIAFVTSIFDYARVRLLFAGDRAAMRSVGDAFRFTFAHFPSVFGLAILNVAVASLIFVAFLWLHSRVGLDTSGGMLVGILAGQISIGARLWCRIATYGSEIALWSAHDADRAKNLD
jgi:hypothetical protein